MTSNELPLYLLLTYLLLFLTDLKITLVINWAFSFIINYLYLFKLLLSETSFLKMRQRRNRRKPPGGQQKNKTKAAPTSRQRGRNVKQDKSSHKLLFWTREGGRLKKLERPAEVLDDDIIMMDVQHVQSILSRREQVANQRLPDENTCSHHPVPDNNTSNQHPVPDNNRISLLNLPNELLVHIILFLDVDSVASLGQVNQRLHDFVETNYYIHLMIPCNQTLMDKLVQSQRKILRLTSNCMLKNLQDPLTGEFQVNKLNLTALKVLQLYGNNYNMYADHMYRYTLTELYVTCLEYILSTVNPTSFTSLGFILDHTLNRWNCRINPLLAKLTSLNTLTIHGKSTGLVNSSLIWDHNPSINSILSVSCAKHVMFKNFLQYESTPMIINNPHIVSLEVDFGKTGSLRLKNMDSLVRLHVAEMYFNCNCLRHYSKGKLFTDLVKEAPNLRYYNEIDLKIIEEKSGLKDIRWYDCPLVRDIQLFHDLSEELLLRKDTERRYISYLKDIERNDCPFVQVIQDERDDKEKREDKRIKGYDY